MPGWTILVLGMIIRPIQSWVFKTAAGVSPSPRGRVALLGIAKRQIRVSRAHVPAVCIRRKPLPTSIKTLGDLIQIRRYEKRLTLRRLVLKMGIAITMLRAWESDTDRPNEQQMKQLAQVLDFGDALSAQ